MRYFTFLFVLLASCGSLSAQHGEQAAKELVQEFFAGLNAQDTAMIRSTLFEEVEIATVVKGSRPVKVESVQHFLSSVQRSKNMQLEEKIVSYKTLIDEELAIVWAPYEFYINEQLSHCGVNAFTLILTENGWKIHNIIDTRRKENCHSAE